jgi:hypothetical protein
VLPAVPGNVTVAHDSSPISAALAAYDFIIAHDGNRGSEMQDVSAKKTTTTKVDDRKAADRKAHCERTLTGCYGQIGISAVAAAARYQGSAKNPAYAPASNQWRHRIAEAAA